MSTLVPRRRSFGPVFVAALGLMTSAGLRPAVAQTSAPMSRMTGNMTPSPEGMRAEKWLDD